MDTWTTVEVERGEMDEGLTDLLRPVIRASRGLRRIRLHDADVRIHEDEGKIFFVLSGTSDFQRETEIYVDLEDLVPRGKHRKAREIFRSVLEFVGE